MDCDIFIEDRYENAIQLSEAGFEVLLIGTNYNNGPINANIHRVKNWYEIENFILEYTAENGEETAAV